jgi:hypothetical protein
MDQAKLARMQASVRIGKYPRFILEISKMSTGHSMRSIG